MPIPIDGPEEISSVLSRLPQDVAFDFVAKLQQWGKLGSFIEGILSNQHSR
jgi:hypothetical protein